MSSHHYSSAAERLNIAVTREVFVSCPIQEVFDFVAAEDVLPKILTGYGMVPGAKAHDLDALLNEAKARGLKPTASQTASVLRRLNQANKQAAIRYDFSFSAVPMAEEVQHVIAALLKDTAPALPTLAPD